MQEATKGIVEPAALGTLGGLRQYTDEYEFDAMLSRGGEENIWELWSARLYGCLLQI